MRNTPVRVYPTVTVRPHVIDYEARNATGAGIRGLEGSH